MANARVPHAHMSTLAAVVLAKGENSHIDQKQKINRGLVLENQINLVAAHGTTHLIIEQLPSSSPHDQHAHPYLACHCQQNLVGSLLRGMLMVVDESVEVRVMGTRW